VSHGLDRALGNVLRSRRAIARQGKQEHGDERRDPAQHLLKIRGRQTQAKASAGTAARTMLPLAEFL
jgi:hypothetical protein